MIEAVMLGAVHTHTHGYFLNNKKRRGEQQ